MLRFDFISISGAQVTPEGWIRDRPVVARSGIQEYRGPNGAVRREYRPPDEVFHADALASLHAVPVTNGHPGVVSAESPAAIIGSSLSPGIQQDGNVLAEIVIHNPKAMGPNRELSLGYRVDLDETPGEVDGQRYDAVQRNIRINHIAVVHRGRAGNARLRLDHDDAASGQVEEEPNMSDTKLVSVRLDGLDYQASPEVKRAMERHDEAIQAAKDAAKAAGNRADTAEAARDALQARLDAAEAEKEQFRKDALSQAKARLSLEASAKEVGVEVRADASDRDLRAAVVTKLRTDAVDLAGKSDAYVDAAFDIAMADQAARQRAIAGQRQAVAGGTANPAPRSDAADPYEAMKASMRDAWKGAA